MNQTATLIDRRSPDICPVFPHKEQEMYLEQEQKAMNLYAKSFKNSKPIHIGCHNLKGSKGTSDHNRWNSLVSSSSKNATNQTADSTPKLNLKFKSPLVSSNQVQTP